MAAITWDFQHAYICWCMQFHTVMEAVWTHKRSPVKVDSGRRSSCHTRELNLHQQLARCSSCHTRELNLHQQLARCSAHHTEPYPHPLEIDLLPTLTSFYCFPTFQGRRTQSGCLWMSPHWALSPPRRNWLAPHPDKFLLFSNLSGKTYTIWMSLDVTTLSLIPTP